MHLHGLFKILKIVLQDKSICIFSTSENKYKSSTKCNYCISQELFWFLAIYILCKNIYYQQRCTDKNKRNCIHFYWLHINRTDYKPLIFIYFSVLCLSTTYNIINREFIFNIASLAHTMIFMSLQHNVHHNTHSQITLKWNKYFVI